MYFMGRYMTSQLLFRQEHIWIPCYVCATKVTYTYICIQCILKLQVTVLSHIYSASPELCTKYHQVKQYSVYPHPRSYIYRCMVDFHILQQCGQSIPGAGYENISPHIPEILSYWANMEMAVTGEFSGRYLTFGWRRVPYNRFVLLATGLAFYRVQF